MALRSKSKRYDGVLFLCQGCDHEVGINPSTNQYGKHDRDGNPLKPWQLRLPEVECPNSEAMLPEEAAQAEVFGIPSFA